MGKRSKTGILFFLFIFGVAFASYADVNKTLNTDESELKGVLGVGVLVDTQPYKDVDPKAWPVPLASLEYKNFWIDGRVFGYRLLGEGNWKLSVAGKPRLMGYHSNDSSTLYGMEDREGSFDGGGRFSWESEMFDLKVMVLSDLGGKHNGQEVSAVLSKELLKGFITPRVGVKWLSQNLVDYYFGVRGNEARVWRPAYEPDSTVDAIAGATVALPIGEKWAFVTDLEYEFLGSEITDSPIVDADGVFKCAVGVVYRF